MMRYKNEKPILFSGPMVRAILDGSKTQTRRVIKPQPETGPCVLEGSSGHLFKIPVSRGVNDMLGKQNFIDKFCPYEIGMRLWVRETFQPLWDGPYCDHLRNYKTGEGYKISYPATDGITEFVDLDDNVSSACKPSIHMPRWASRINLEVTDIRVQRVNDISHEDILAEGMNIDLFRAMLEPKASRQKVGDFNRVNISEECHGHCDDHIDAAVKIAQKENPGEAVYSDCDNGTETDCPASCETCGIPLECTFLGGAYNSELDHFESCTHDLLSKPRDCYDMKRILGDYDDLEKYYPEYYKRAIKLGFRCLWNSINAKRGFGWEKNPWVFAYNFKKVEAQNVKDRMVRRNN